MNQDQYLIARGYKKYPPTPLDSELVVTRFQQRFDDEHGKKYFINVVKSSMDFIPEQHRGPCWEPYKYSYEVQVNFGDDEKTLNMEFFSDWPVEHVENFMEEFFDKMKPNHYELWSGERYRQPISET